MNGNETSDKYPPTTGDPEADRQANEDWYERRIQDPNLPVVVDCGWCHRRLNYIPPDTCVTPVYGGDFLAGTGTCRAEACQERTWRNLYIYGHGPQLYPGVPLLVIRQAPAQIAKYRKQA